MPLMRSPDGSETVDVPVEEIRHYLRLGAKLEEPVGGQDLRMPYVGPDTGAGAEDPGLIDPLNFIPVPGAQTGLGLAAGRVASRGIGAGLGAVGGAVKGAAKAATSRVGGPLVRGAGGAGVEMALELLPPWQRILARGAMSAMRGVAPAAGEAAPAAAQAASKAVQPIVGGAEGEAFRTGGRAALDALRASGGGGGIAAHEARQAVQEVGSAVSRTAGEVGTAASRTGSERLSKETAGYIRRRAMATMDQAGFPKEVEASRKAISEILGREVKSRSSLTPDEWLQVTDAATEAFARKAAAEAAKKAAARVVAKAEKGIPKPKVVKMPPSGSAESRVTKAAPKSAPKKAAPRSKASGQKMTAEVPGELQSLLQQSVNVGPEIAKLPPDQQMLAWQMLRQSMGQ